MPESVMRPRTVWRDKRVPPPNLWPFDGTNLLQSGSGTAIGAISGGGQDFAKSVEALAVRLDQMGAQIGSLASSTGTQFQGLGTAVADVPKTISADMSRQFTNMSAVVAQIPKDIGTRMTLEFQGMAGNLTRMGDKLGYVFQTQFKIVQDAVLKIPAQITGLWEERILPAFQMMQQEINKFWSQAMNVLGPIWEDIRAFLQGLNPMVALSKWAQAGQQFFTSAVSGVTKLGMSAAIATAGSAAIYGLSALTNAVGVGGFQFGPVAFLYSGLVFGYAYWPYWPRA